MKEDIDSLYDATCKATLARWAKCGDIGDVVDRPFHPTKLSLTTGNFPGPLASVLDVLAQIRRSVDGDPLADALDPACLHFTFLALSQPDYPSLDHLPDLTDVKQAFARHCHKQIFSLHDLRLVALPNALLIAGSPDTLSASRRAAFAESLLASSWADALRARYPKGDIPPAFWHSTLVRYHADCLPVHVRRIFTANRMARYGNVSLEIGLLATNYNWQLAARLDARSTVYQ